jgi:hypothetical protein
VTRPPLPVSADGPPLAVLVCGSRHWADRQAIHADLRAVEKTGRLMVVVEGDAPGADRVAGRGWAAQARKRGVGWLSVPADWNRYGKAAGSIRNRLMLDWLLQCPGVGWQSVVFAYPLSDSRGTRDMMALARKVGVRVLVRA